MNTLKHDVNGRYIKTGHHVNQRTARECRYSGVPDMYIENDLTVVYDSITCCFFLQNKDGVKHCFLPSCEYEVIL